MNGYECDVRDNFMRWKIKMLVEAKLNTTFDLSPNENICAIAWMKNIHYFFKEHQKYLLSFLMLN